MINTKQTLINLHERFPDMSLDDLFAILECIVELYYYNWDTTCIKNTLSDFAPKIY